MNAYLKEWKCRTSQSRGVNPHCSMHDFSDDEQDVDYDILDDEEFVRRMDDHRRHWHGEWTKIESLREELFHLATGESYSVDFSTCSSPQLLKRGSSTESRDSDIRSVETNEDCLLARTGPLLSEDVTIGNASTASVRSSCSRCNSKLNLGDGSSDGINNHSKIRGDCNTPNSNGDDTSQQLNPFGADCPDGAKNKRSITSNQFYISDGQLNSNSLIYSHQYDNVTRSNKSVIEINPASNVISVSVTNDLNKIFANQRRLMRSDNNVNALSRINELPLNVNPDDVHAAISDPGQLQLTAPLRTDYQRATDIDFPSLNTNCQKQTLNRIHDNNQPRKQPTQLSFSKTSVKTQQQSHYQRQISPNNNTNVAPIVSPVTMEAVLDYRGRVSSRTSKNPRSFLKKLFSG